MGAAIILRLAAVGLIAGGLGLRQRDGIGTSFLIIRADELRAASVGCYGDPHAITPNIDALAAHGVRYTRAFSAEPVCTKYRTSFDVGFYTHATASGEYTHPDDVTIQKLLRDAGWHTAHVGKFHQTEPSLLNSSFPEVVPPSMLAGWSYHAGHEHHHKLVGTQALYYENGSNTPNSAQPWRPQKHVELAIAQIEAAVAAGKRFYVRVDLEPPHFPYFHVDGTQWDVFRPGDVPVPANVPAEHAAEAEYDLAKYYSMVYSLDDMVGQLVRHLQRRGLLDTTVVVFTSDHGSHLGAHGLVGNEEQKRTPYDESIRVPLIVRLPDGPRAAVNRSFFVPVDFSYAILGLAGLQPIDGHHFDHPQEARLLMMDEGDNTPEGTWYGVITSDGWKYARAELAGPGDTPGPWMLFDTAQDPLELRNLVGTGNARVAELDELLDATAAAYGLTIPF
jgi:arylsulfatase A-like enzyme